MLEEFLIELKLYEEQNKITQIVTGSSGSVKLSMYDDYINASKGKIHSKGKGKGGSGKGGKSSWRAPCNEDWKPDGCSQDTSVRSIIQRDSQDDVQSVALLVTILLKAHVQSSLKRQECRVG